VQPVAHEGLLAGVGLGLGDLVLVVRENEVLAAAVYVDLLPQVLEGHGGALDVPAGPSGAPGAVPGRLAGLGGLPEGEVHGVLLALAGLHSGAGHHVVQVAPGELPVVVLPLHPIVDVAVLLPRRRRGRVRVAPLDERLDHLDHLRDFLGGAGVLVGGQDVKSPHVLEVAVDEALSQLRLVDFQAGGPGYDAVVDVSEVLDVTDAPASVLQVTAQHVEDDVAHGVADVVLVVRGHAADVHPHGVAQRDELLFLTCKSVY
jgi:hypothetical protein